MRPSKRLITLVVLAGAAAVTATALAAIGGRGVTRAAFSTPSGRPGEFVVRAVKPSTGSWCAKAVVDPKGRPVERDSCGTGAPRGFHGSLIADCLGHELILIGELRPGTTVTQRRRGKSTVRAVSVRRPKGLRFSGEFYVIAVDLGQKPPVLRATDGRGRNIRRMDFTPEARRCRKAVFLLGEI